MGKQDKDFWQFYEVVHQKTTPLFLRKVDPDLLNPLFGLPQKIPQHSRPPISNFERYWVGWFRAWSEIYNSYERLGHAVAFLSHFPQIRVFRLHSISEGTWMRYHLEMYIQEEYILFQRLKEFLTKIERLAKRCHDAKGAGIASQLRVRVEAAFQNPIILRGQHVHRFRFDDSAISNVDAMVLLTGRIPAGRRRKFWKAWREVKYIEAQKKWTSTLRANNKQLKLLCCQIVAGVTPIVERNEPAP